MKTLSLRQAALETGKSKSTISNALKTGKISYISKDHTGYKIDPSELFRVYPRTSSEQVELGHLRNTPEDTDRTHGELALLREMLEREREINKGLNEKLDRSEDERREIFLRLEHLNKKKKFLGIF
jgi:hypothetical protein